MSDPNLFDFVDVLRSAGRLRRVGHGVKTHFELAEFVRQLRAGERETTAVLFEHPGDGQIPVLASTYSTYDSVAKAFAVESTDELAQRIGAWLRPRGGRGVRDVLAMLPALTKALPWADSGRKARCQQVVRLGRDVDLATLPIPHCWPAESGPTLTGGLLVTRSADGEQTIETAVAEVVDGQSLRVRLSNDSPALDSWTTARAEGRQLDVALCFGGPPALWPTVWLGEVLGVDAAVLGEVFGQPQPETVRGRTVAAVVPSGSEIVLEGKIDPELAPSDPGRVATDWGRVASAGTWATISVHAITHAAAAVLPVVIRHAPPHDLAILDHVAEQCLEQLVCSLVPGVGSLRTPSFGAARQIVVLGIESSRASRSREIAAAVRGLHGLSKAKVVVLIDNGLSLDDESAVLSSIVEYVAPGRDLQIVDTARSPDDPSGADSGSAVIIDATSAVSSERMRKARPSPAVADAVRKLLSES